MKQILAIKTSIGTLAYRHIASLFTMAFLLISTLAFAQQNTTAAGGNATGAGGSVSYSIGQIDYITETGAGGKATQGVQQPALPCPTATSANVVGCPTIPINLIGTPAGGVFSIANPYLGPTTTYTYTYTDISIGCSSTSTPSTATVSNMAPAIPNPVVVGNTVATITWTAVPGSTIYYVWYRPVGNITWITPSTANTFLNLTGLLPNTNYEFKIRNNNAACSQLGVFGPLYNFTTLNSPCGTATTFITAFTLTNTTALVKWVGLPGVAQYNLYYKKAIDVTWNTLMFAGGTTQYLLTGLTPNTMYNVKIRNRCTGEVTFSTFGSIYTFGTPLKPGDISNAVNSNIKIFPNPTNDILNIEIESTTSGTATLKLLDMTGRLVKQVQANTIEGLNNYSISLKELAQGSYTLQVYENDKLSLIEKVAKIE